MQMRPNTSMAAVPGTDFSGLANLMAMKGRGGDNTLVHMSKSELPYLNMLAKSAGYPQGLPVNPETGLPEANILKTILPVAGAILGGMFAPQFLPAFLGKGALATGIGAGLGSFGGSLLSGRSLKDAAIGGLISGGLSGLGAAAFGGQSFMGDTTSFTNPAAAQLAGREAAKASAMTGVENFSGMGVPPGSGGAFGGVQTAAPELASAQLSAFPNTAYEAGLSTAPEIGGGAFGPTQFGSSVAPNSFPLNVAEAYRSAPIVAPGFAPGAAPIEPLTGDLAKLGAAYGDVTPAQALSAPTRAAFEQASPVALTKDFVPGNVSDLARVGTLPKEAGFLDAKALYGYQPGMDKLEYLKYAAKPAMTAGAVGVGVDALLEQGAFEPIDYSSFPQAGEDRRVSPFDTSGIRFASRRTGAFPRTEEEALAFAQPGGTRRRFFDQEFLTSAKTGGGLATLEVKKFEDGGPGDDAGDDAGDDDGGVAGDAESAAAGAPGPGTGDDSGEDFGGEFGGFGDDTGGLGAVSGVAGAADAAAAAAADAALAEQTLTVPTPRATEEDIEEDLFDVEMGLPSPVAPTPDVSDMTDFGPLGRSDIADQLGGKAVNPGISRYGYQSGIGRGIFGGYTSSDIDTAKSDVDQGFDTAPVGSFSPFGFVADVGKTALNVAVPGLGFGVDAVQQVSMPSGTGTLGALGNVLGDEDVEDATTKAEGGLLKMAKGGDTLSFFSPAFGLGRAAKKGGIEGALSFLSPAFALSQGQLPGPLNNLMSAQSGKAEQQAPAVRDAEAPTEQIALPPTKEELEEARDVAVLQQVLAGVPVEAQAGGLISAYQMGGPPSPYFEGMVKGRGDGMSDSIPFTIEGTQPAILSRDEYVLPADIVSMMGNGSSDAGAEKIDTFINDFRVQKYGRGKQPPETRRGLSGVA